MFFTQMALEARRCAKEIHFTLPESLWCTKRRFFESFGFTSPVKAFRQYRASDGELACSAPQSVVWQAALEGLPALMCKFAPGGFSLGNRILISVQPKYAECIIGGKKSVEIRKRFSRRWLGCRAVLYASHPVSALVAEATISGIASGAPDEIWSEYGSRVGAELEEFEAYTAGCNEVNAIELTDVAKYIAPVSTSELSYLTRADLRPPQSFCDLHPERCNPWTAAVAVATLLHGRFDYLPGS
jgi:predicted transcriptional regulator